MKSKHKNYINLKNAKKQKKTYMDKTHKALDMLRY